MRLTYFSPLVIPVRSLLLLIVMAALSPSVLAQSPEGDCRPRLEEPRQETSAVTRSMLFRVKVEDAIEADLITQQLGIRPEIVRGRTFYYCGNDRINTILRGYGYDPEPDDPEQVFSRVVRVVQKGKEEELQDFGVTLILREREFWVVEASYRQLRVLQRRGYEIREIGKREPRPRQVKLTVQTPDEVQLAAKLGVDIYGVTRAEKKDRALYIYGGAFDNTIDALRQQGFKVEILADPPGVTR